MTVSLRYLHYDVFTANPLEGNQLAVFPDGRNVSTERMQAIAREMNFSESTFILPAEATGTDVRMRIFTPHAEMPMAGHPTVGSTFALVETGAIAPERKRFVFGLNVGPTPVDLEWKDGHLAFAWMTQLIPEFGAPVSARQEVAAALGVSEEDLMPHLPIQPVSCGVPFLYVPLRTPEIVDRAMGDAAALRRLASVIGINLPVFVFAFSKPATAYSRMFAPGLGVAEDPATGGASGPLGGYLVRHGLVTGDAARSIVNVQGVAMRRPSQIHIDIREQAGTISAVKVGGTAVLAGRGELLIR